MVKFGQALPASGQTTASIWREILAKRPIPLGSIGARPEHGMCSWPPRRTSNIEESEEEIAMTMGTSVDPHAQLRSLYMSLLTSQEHFDEFKRLLALYDVDPETWDTEPKEALVIRQRLNDRIRAWTGGSFEGLSAQQLLQWRAIVVEERFNVALSPWKESNTY
jgi:hypothetical protein